MPSFKLKGKAQEVKSGFEPYDGPEPSRNGMYRGIIKVMKHGLNSSKSEGFSITIELAAAPGDPKGHAQFDGFPMFSRSVITDTVDGSALKEGAQRNLDNLLAALGTGDNPEVVLDSGDGDKVDVKKIGGRNPIGAVVNVDLQMKMFEGERRPEIGGIYPYKEIDAPKATGKGRAAALVVEDDEPEDDEADLMEGSDEAEGDDEFAEREAELNALGIPALKKIAKELEIGISGTKAALVERILDAEFAEEDDAAEDESEDGEGDEDEVEDDEAEEDDEEEDDEPEDDEEREARVAELDAMARPALKAVLKEIAPDFTVLKRHTDDNLREQIIGVEFSEDLPF